MGSWTAACRPADRPHDCPLESWEELFGENGVADYFDPCRQQVTGPAYFYVPQLDDCVERVEEGINFVYDNVSIYEDRCQPAVQPDSCPDDSWNQLFGENGVGIGLLLCPYQSTQVTPPPYALVPNVEDCLQRREQGTMISYDHYVAYEDSCQPLSRPANCPVDSWNQLFGQDGVGLVLPPCFGEFLHN